MKQIAAALAGNVISIKDLQKLAGRANHIAGGIVVWRPFLQQLWAALAATHGTALMNCVWVKSIRSALLWLKVFLEGTRGTLVRRFTLETWTNVAPDISITLDASPWGVGATLEINHVIVAYLRSPLDRHDVDLLGHPIGEACGQQVWETLCALVALRAWKAHWKESRFNLLIRGDSVTMLTVVLDMRPSSSSPGLGLLAREMALGSAEGCYQPEVHAQHVAGRMNVIADILSRDFDKELVLPPMLEKVTRTIVPKRDLSWYRALASPQ